MKSLISKLKDQFDEELEYQGIHPEEDEYVIKIYKSKSLDLWLTDDGLSVCFGRKDLDDDQIIKIGQLRKLLRQEFKNYDIKELDYLGLSFVTKSKNARLEHMVQYFS